MALSVYYEDNDVLDAFSISILKRCYCNEYMRTVIPI
jgi:hypothetical protein